MNYPFARSRRSFQAIRAIACVLVASCFLPSVSWASRDRPPSSGRSSGTRGCGTTTLPVQPEIPALILLAPTQQPGKTASSRPTFAWFVRDAEQLPMEFRLYEQTPKGFQLVKEIKSGRLKSTPGIMVLPADPTMPELVAGKTYRWQIELVCNLDRPSGNLFAEAEIQVVPLHPHLKSQIQQQRDRTKQAQLYDQANLWYDSLSVAFSPLSGTDDLKDVQLALLTRVALSSSEQTVLQNSKVHWFNP